MREQIIRLEDVSPAEITVDDLLLDPDLPINAQVDDVKEDLFMAEFPNGCALRVGWYPSFNPAGEFVVTLRQYPGEWDDDAGYEQHAKLFEKLDQWPITDEHRCHSIEELKGVVGELARKAKGA